MRLRSVQATFTALALLIGSGVAAQAQSESFFAENEAPAPAAPDGAAKARPDANPDPLPTGSLNAPRTNAALPQGKPEGLAKATEAKPAAKAGDKGQDPEPDGVVVPLKAPSADPLDALSTPAAPHGATKAGAPAAGVPDAAKRDPAKPGEATTQGATSGAADPAKPQQAEVLPPLNAAIKAALDKRETAPLKGANVGERRKERKAVAFLYAAHGFAPLWSADGKASVAVASLLERLAHSGDDGLTVPQVPSAVAATGEPAAIADSDIDLTDAIVAYARQATGSRVDPTAISPLIGVKRPLADPAEVVDALTAAGVGAGDKLWAMNPVEPRYVALRDKLAALRASRDASAQGVSHGAASAQAIPAGPTLRLGMHDKRVPLVRARLAVPPALDGDDRDYDQDVADAVSAFQRSNGLPPSGSLTRRTVDALSGGESSLRPSKLEAAIVANMEMWRWMPRDLGGDRIEVNVPDFVVTVFHNNAPVSTNRVVVGKIETPTPLFSNTMKYLIVNPYWNVPQSIIKNELLPKGGGSLSYLEGRGYSVSSANGMPVVKQLPGDKNALGRIKFLFPNDYSVYLHDTPSKSLFAASKRAFSHGCVRVDKPFSFAESVLNDTPDQRRAWSQDRLEDMIGEKEHYVNLPAALPIHIEYFTVSVDGPGGAVKRRDDVYGYANAVAAALNLESDTVPIAGRVKPAPVVAERIERPHRRTIATVEVAEPAPPVVTRSFWSIFDPR